MDRSTIIPGPDPQDFLSNTITTNTDASSACPTGDPEKVEEWLNKKEMCEVLFVHFCQPDAPALARTLMYLASVDSLHPSINHTCTSSSSNSNLFLYSPLSTPMYLLLSLCSLASVGAVSPGQPPYRSNAAIRTTPVSKKKRLGNTVHIGYNDLIDSISYKQFIGLSRTKYDLMDYCSDPHYVSLRVAHSRCPPYHRRFWDSALNCAPSPRTVYSIIAP